MTRVRKFSRKSGFADRTQKRGCVLQPLVFVTMQLPTRRFHRALQVAHLVVARLDRPRRALDGGTGFGGQVFILHGRLERVENMILAPFDFVDDHFVVAAEDSSFQVEKRPMTLRALSDSLRRNSKPLPCSAFVPDLVVRLTTPPLKRPNSAGGLLLSILKS